MASGGVDDFDKIADPRKRNWFKRARNHGHVKESFVEVFPGTAEFHAWSAYFDGMGWRPVTFPCGRRRSKDGRWEVLFSPSGTKSWTAPCRWPQELGF